MNNMSKEGGERKFNVPMLLSNDYGNVRSRYLKYPTGSCHDLCKYGRKHDYNNDEKRLTFRKFIANRATLEAAHSIEKDPIVYDRKNKLLIKMTSDLVKVAEHSIQPKKDVIATLSSKHESDICYSQFILPEDSIFFKAPSPTHKSTEPVKEIQPQANDEENDRPQISLGVFLDENKGLEISEQLINSKPLDEEIKHVKFSDCSMSKKQANKSKASSLVTKCTPAKSSIFNQKSPSGSTENSRGDTNFFKKTVASNLKESTVFKGLKVIKQDSTVSGKQSTPKLQNSNPNAFLSHRKTNVSAKPASSLIVRSLINAPRYPNGPTIPHEYSNSGIPKVEEMKSMRSLRASISSREPILSSMSMNATKSKYVKHRTPKNSGKYKVDYGHIDEKILAVIEPESEGKTRGLNQKLSKESDGHASMSAVREVSNNFLNGRNQSKHRRSYSKEEEQRCTRRTPAVSLADNSSSPYKLKFKRGKVIELESAESVAPRRLRFRRGKLLGENPSGDVVKRSSRRKRGIGEFDDSNSGIPDILLKKANLEPKGIKLKHQDAQVKKDMQSLFNNVIEETASKLIEIRKGKVKALVGAFESVILLQESKSASTV